VNLKHQKKKILIKKIINKMKIDWYDISRKYLDIRNQKQFVCNFGVLPFVCDFLFSIVEKYVVFQPIHLIMSLYFLKVYPFDEQASAIWKTTRKTVSKYVWGILSVLYLHFTSEGSLVNNLNLFLIIIF
jgi:hypothetical protein